MSKKPPVKKPVPKGPKVQVLQPAPELVNNQNDFYNNTLLHVILLAAITFGVYFNSIFSDYVLDDMISITHNSFTLKGFGGIKDLITHDSFVGFTGMENQLSGGRYRPLAMVTFAIEIGLWGQKPHISHFFNVVLYTLLILLLYRFLKRFIFKDKPLACFITCLLFAVHPTHTEVVANIKSRDEIMSMGFLLLGLTHLFNYATVKKTFSQLLYMGIFFILSLLSKENALVYIVLGPLFLYFFTGQTLKKSFSTALPIFLVLLLYFILRVKMAGFKMLKNGEILNAPYLFATAQQAFATKVALMSKYLGMLIFPNKLSYDYSYNAIPYINVWNLKFLFSLVLNSALLVYAFINFNKKHLISFCILFYFINMGLVSNFIFDVGTAYADRFLFQPSLALAMIIGYYSYLYIYKPDQLGVLKKKFILTAGLLVVTALASFKTVTRNKDWTSEAALFQEDVKVYPTSAKTNNNCGVVLINISTNEANPTRKKQLIDEAVEKIKLSVKIHPKYADAWLNLGVAYSRYPDVVNAEAAWLQAQVLSPAHPKLKEYLPVLGDMWANEGFKYNAKKDYANSVICYQKAVDYHGRNLAENLYNLGGNFLMIGNVQKAREMWEKTLEVKPDHAEARKWLNQINGPAPK